MTAELQEMLYREQQIGVSGLAVNVDPKGNNLTVVQKVNFDFDFVFVSNAFPFREPYF
ncbi:unnamed protein product [Camellia sinensis]